MELDAWATGITLPVVLMPVAPPASMTPLPWPAVFGSAVAKVGRKAVSLFSPGAGTIRSRPEMARYLDASALVPLKGEPGDATPDERRRVACLVAMDADPGLYMRLNIRHNVALALFMGAAMPLAFTGVMGAACTVILPIMAMAKGVTWAAFTEPNVLSTLGMSVTASIVPFLLMRFPLTWLMNKWQEPLDGVIESMRMGGWADTLPSLVDRFSFLTPDASTALLSLRGVVLWHAIKANESWKDAESQNSNRSKLSMTMLRLLGTGDYIGMSRLHARLDACVNVGAVHGFKVSGEESELLARVNDRLRDRSLVATGA